MSVDKDSLARCRVCRCTESDACNPPCSWSDADLCSGCMEVLTALVHWKEGAHRPNMAALLREWEETWEETFRALSRRAGEVRGHDPAAKSLGASAEVFQRG